MFLLGMDSKVPVIYVCVCEKCRKCLQEICGSQAEFLQLESVTVIGFCGVPAVRKCFCQIRNLCSHI